MPRPAGVPTARGRCVGGAGAFGRLRKIDRKALGGGRGGWVFALGARTLPRGMMAGGGRSAFHVGELGTLGRHAPAAHVRLPPAVGRFRIARGPLQPGVEHSARLRPRARGVPLAPWGQLPRRVRAPLQPCAEHSARLGPCGRAAFLAWQSRTPVASASPPCAAVPGVSCVPQRVCWASAGEAQCAGWCTALLVAPEAALEGFRTQNIAPSSRRRSNSGASGAVGYLLPPD